MRRVITLQQQFGICWKCIGCSFVGLFLFLWWLWQSESYALREFECSVSHPIQHRSTILQSHFIFLWSSSRQLHLLFCLLNSAVAGYPTKAGEWIQMKNILPYLRLGHTLMGSYWTLLSCQDFGMQLLKLRQNKVMTIQMEWVTYRMSLLKTDNEMMVVFWASNLGTHGTAQWRQTLAFLIFFLVSSPQWFWQRAWDTTKHMERRYVGEEQKPVWYTMWNALL